MKRPHADLLRYIAGFQESAGGISPSFRQMAQSGLRGRKGLTDALDEMADDGRLTRLRARARAIQLHHIPSIPRSPTGEPLYWIRIK
jgi:hypothetical protein